jgi:hypothetical protein
MSSLQAIGHRRRREALGLGVQHVIPLKEIVAREPCEAMTPRRAGERQRRESSEPGQDAASHRVEPFLRQHAKPRVIERIGPDSVLRGVFFEPRGLGDPNKRQLRHARGDRHGETEACDDGEGAHLSVQRELRLDAREHLLEGDDLADLLSTVNCPELLNVFG